MKTKLYVLVHINADSCRNKKVETKSFMSLDDARAEMKRQWDAELEQLNDHDAEDDFAIDFQRYINETAFIEDMRAGLPYGVKEDIETNEDYWEIVEVGSDALPKVVGYQIICSNGMSKWMPRGYNSFDVFDNKEDAERYIEDYNVKNATVKEVRSGDINRVEYIIPMKRHHKLEVGERVCVLERADEYIGWGVVLGIEDGTVNVELKAYSDGGEIKDNQKAGIFCSPYDVFQIVPNKNYEGEIVCYENNEESLTGYFTPAQYFNLDERELEDGEPDFENLD